MPIKESALGTVSFGAQEGICLGPLNLRRPSRTLSWGEIPRVFNILSEIGNVQRKVFSIIFDLILAKLNQISSFIKYRLLYTTILIIVQLGPNLN